MDFRDSLNKFKSGKKENLITLIILINNFKVGVLTNKDIYYIIKPLIPIFEVLMPRQRVNRDRGTKVWFTIQMPVELRNAISDKADRENLNASEFFRLCAEIFVSTDSNKEALKKVEKMAARLKLTGTARKWRPSGKKKDKRKIVAMPDTSKMI